VPAQQQRPVGVVRKSVHVTHFRSERRERRGGGASGLPPRTSLFSDKLNPPSAAQPDGPRNLSTNLRQTTKKFRHEVGV
jgi:hypothetical protein